MIRRGRGYLELIGKVGEGVLVDFYAFIVVLRISEWVFLGFYVVC